MSLDGVLEYEVEELEFPAPARLLGLKYGCFPCA